MKKTVLVLVAMIALSATASVAQKVMVVDSEKIFKSIAAYNTAIAEADAMAQKYQKQVDDAFDKLETQFNNYQSQKASMTAYARQQAEQQIIDRENEITKFQQESFGEEGTVLKKRIELIKPIQDKVFAAINSYAEKGGYDMVIDKASNANLLYVAPSTDHTDAIIAIVK
ncbi:MAG: OmpH family outer membrane protein [Rikenellaceae bacterium]|jgi:outer membrane protein|nr:OmpH family outer membrane protein [Rikenellaceae bacterium]